MDLILLDKNFAKSKPIVDFISFDAVVGFKSYSENDFVLKVPYNKELFNKGQFIAYGTSEYGGIITKREIDTNAKQVTYKGSSIRGFWQRNFKGVTDLTISGTITDHVSQFIGWGNVSLVNQTDIINNAGDGRMSLTYEGATSLLHCIDRALKNFGATMTISIINGRLKVVINPSITHYFDSSQATVRIEENWSAPTLVYAVNNDLNIGASAYLQADGTVGREPYYTGLDTIESVVTSNKTTGEDLYAVASEELLKQQEFMATEVDVKISKAEVGDSVVASIAEIGLKIEKKIVEKRLILDKKKEKITYTLEG